MNSHRWAAALALGLAGSCAALLPSAAPVLSPQPASERLRLRFDVRGVQVYVCQRADGAAPSWQFVEPEAALFDEDGQPLGSHGAGPAWQADDGARIVGSVVAKVDGPGGDVIAWLLLRSGPGGGSDRLAGLTAVQRIHTEGGAAPAEGCGDAELGRIARVPYTARYTFFESAP